MIDIHARFGDNDDFATTDVAILLRLLDAHGVERAALAPVGRLAAVDNRESNDRIAAAVQAHPDRLAGWATANAWYGRRAVDEVRRALDAGLVGIKVVPAQQGITLLSPLLDRLLEVAASRRVPVYVSTGVPVAAEPLQLTELARRWPTVAFVMGRSGRTDFALDLIPALLRAPNLVAETAHNGVGDLRSIIAAVGEDRMVFASDMPMNDLGLEVDRVASTGLSPAALDAAARHLFTRSAG